MIDDGGIDDERRRTHTAPLPPPAAGGVDRGVFAAAQSRTLLILCGSGAVGRAGITVGFAVASLLVKEMLHSSTWAGASTAAITIGTAISASALSGVMNRRGRRPGLVVGYLAAIVGAGVAVVGGQTMVLPLFLLGLTLIGVGQGATNLARFAAADLAVPARRGQAISLVVFASTVGAVGGPALVGPAGSVADRIGLHELIGPFLFAVVLFVVTGLIVWVGLRPDPLVVAGGLRPGGGPGSGVRGGFSEGIRGIAARPLAVVAVVSMSLSQAVMVTVMAMTPLHMDAHGHDLGVIGWVISVHTAGMFAFAPVAGWASDRFGRLAVVTTGGVMLAVATSLTALAGEAPVLLMFPGLFLLGLGWSFGMVSGSALLTDVIPTAGQVTAQGAADLVTSFVSGVAAIGSGFVFSMAGFHVLSLAGLAAAGVVTLTGFVRLRVEGTDLRA